MSEPSDRRQTAGIFAFVLGVGIPGAHMSGFFSTDGEPFPLVAYLAVAAVGGVLGGWLMGRASPLAGVVGGLVAGLGGLLAVHLYTQGRKEVYHLELVAVQAAASLPGLGLYFLIKKMTAAPAPPPPTT